MRRVARNKIIDRYRHNALITQFPLEQAVTKEDSALTPEQFTEQMAILHERGCSGANKHWIYAIGSPGYAVAAGEIFS